MSKKYISSKKIVARKETIINQYKEIFNLPSLPKDKQYWTLCASNSTNSGEILPGGELHQMLHFGLIKSEQFFGVDIVNLIIEKNKIVIPNANWFNGDLYEIMVKENKYGRFSPGIINCDILLILSSVKASAEASNSFSG